MDVDVDDEISVDHDKPGVFIVLTKAPLEFAKIGENYELLSCDEHRDYLLENSRNPEDFRPDITYMAIHSVLDSRVNKHGRLKALYIETQEGRLIEIKPHARMPRTYKRFARLMVQLLQTRRITRAGSRERLLRIIYSPVSQNLEYLPLDSRKIGFSHSSKKLVDMHDYVGTIDNGLDLIFVVGAMAKGKIDEEYVDDCVSIFEFPTTAAYCISTITNSVERLWKLP